MWLHYASSSTVRWFSDHFFYLVCGYLEKGYLGLIKHVDVFQALCACVCVNAGFIASNWAWLHEPMLGYRGTGPGRGKRWACPRCGVTFEPRQVALEAWQEVKGEAMSVNEALYAGVIEETIWLDRS